MLNFGYEIIVIAFSQKKNEKVIPRQWLFLILQSLVND